MGQGHPPSPSFSLSLCLSLSLSHSLPLSGSHFLLRLWTKPKTMQHAQQHSSTKQQSKLQEREKEGEQTGRWRKKTLVCMSEVPALPFCLSFPPCTSSMRYNVQPFTVCLQLASIMYGIMCVSKRVCG